MHNTQEETPEKPAEAATAEMKGIHRFSDFADEKPLDGEKLPINKILGKEITMLAFEIRSSKYQDNSGTYAKFQYLLDGEKHISFTGSKILQEQLNKYQDKMPFITTLIKPDRYITLS